MVDEYVKDEERKTNAEAKQVFNALSQAYK